MKTVFPNDMLAHVWAQQNQDTGRGNNGTFHFTGPVIYSYAMPLARFADPRTVLLTTGSASSTTSCHHGMTQRAIPSGVKVFTVPFIGDVDHKKNAADYSNRLESLCAKASRAKANLPTIMALIETLAQDQIEYIAHFKVKGVKPFEMPASFDAETIKARGKETEARNAKANAAKERKAKKELDDRIEKWKSGAHDTRLAISGDQFLRVNPSDENEIQTSAGATFPLKHAKRALKTIRAGKVYERNGHTIHVGSFAIDRIDEAGNVVAGCHTIKREEIERLAAQLGL